MTPERWRQIEHVYHGACKLSARDLPGFLDEACGSDRDLRAEVESLLAYETAAVRFLREPAGAADPSGEGANRKAGRARRQPFHWFLRIAATFAIASFGYAAVLMTRPSPVFGWSRSPSVGTWFVSSVATSGPAAGLLRRGDVLTRLNGDANVERAGPDAYFRALSIGDEYRLTVRRDGQEHEFRLRVDMGTPDLGASLMQFLTSLVWCGVGLFIGFVRPDHAAARLASAAALATGLLFLHVGMIRAAPVWNPLHVVLGYHFFLLFPTGVAPRGRWRLSLYVMYVAGTVPVLIRYAQWVTELSYGPAAATAVVAAHPLVQVTARLLGMTTYGAALAGIVAVIPWSYRRLASEDERRRVQWIVLGSAVAVSAQLWWATRVIVRFLTGPSTLPRLELSALTVAIPLVVGYAVVKHQVFDVRVAIRRGLQYLLARRALQGLIAVPVVVVVSTAIVQRHRTIADLMNDNTAYIAWIALAAVGLVLRRRIVGWLDRRFFREHYESDKVLSRLVDDLQTAESPTELSRIASARLEAVLHPKMLCFWYVESGELVLDYSSSDLSQHADFPVSGGLLSHLERQSAVLDVSQVATDVSPADAAWLAGVGAAHLIPINDSNERLDGVWLVGERRSETPYTEADRRLLQTVARQTAVQRENLRLRSQMTKDRLVQRDVLARLDRASFNLLKECPTCGRCFDATQERCEDDLDFLTMSLPVQRTIDDKYRLDRLIGRGGMGAVYEASDLRLDRTVAVKIMVGHAFGSLSALRRFRREARAAASLNHPNVVSVFDFGLLEGEGAYLVMERVHGVTLRTRLDDEGRLPPAEAADWFDPLLAGLAAAHAEGVIHRDLKPENIVGERRETRLTTVKILDFGLARFRTSEASRENLTAAGFVVGTLGYMSPEQLAGLDADERSDLFAVGAILAEALTGPGRGKARGAEWARALLQDADNPSGRLYGNPVLTSVLHRCLAESPSDRPASAAALRRELIPALRGASR